MTQRLINAQLGDGLVMDGRRVIAYEGSSPSYYYPIHATPATYTHSIFAHSRARDANGRNIR